jgi:predicted transcriptional regulator
MEVVKMNLNPHEEKVLKVIKSQGVATIREIATKEFPGVRPIQKADSRVRNALRKLVKAQLVMKTDRGAYFFTSVIPVKKPKEKVRLSAKRGEAGEEKELRMAKRKISK